MHGRHQSTCPGVQRCLLCPPSGRLESVTTHEATGLQSALRTASIIRSSGHVWSPIMTMMATSSTTACSDMANLRQVCCRTPVAGSCATLYCAMQVVSGRLDTCDVQILAEHRCRPTVGASGSKQPHTVPSLPPLPAMQHPRMTIRMAPAAGTPARTSLATTQLRHKSGGGKYGSGPHSCMPSGGCALPLMALPDIACVSPLWVTRAE